MKNPTVDKVCPFLDKEISARKARYDLDNKQKFILQRIEILEYLLCVAYSFTLFIKFVCNLRIKEKISCSYSTSVILSIAYT